MIYAPAKFIVATSNGFTRNTLFDLDIRDKVKQNVVQCPLNYVTFAAAKFEVDMSNDQEEGTFTKQIDLDLWVKVI